MRDGTMIIAVGWILAAATAVGALIFRHRVRNLLERIRNRLDEAVSGNYKEVHYNDELESAIGEEVNRLLGILKEQRQEHEREQKLMKQFLSDVSHQIKTPLSNIMVYTELVENSPELTKEDQEMLELVIRQSEKLDFLISTLMKASRMELEMIRIHTAWESLDELVRLCCEEKAYASEKKNISFLAKPSKVVCRLDKQWMQEALGNILDNAVKYSPCGSIVHISVTKYGLFWCIHIKDSGCGIREEEQGLIFQRFYRSENSCNEQGLGIGLYLAREIVRQHSGYIEVHSKQGEGAEFRVLLPQN